MQLGQTFKISLLLFGLASVSLNVGHAIALPVFFNYPSVYDSSGVIRPGSIEKLSPDGTRTTMVSGLDYPSGMAFDAAGNLYYGNVTDSLSRVDLFKWSRDGTVTNLGQVIDRSAGAVYIGGWGFDLAISPSGDIYYNYPSVFDQVHTALKIRSGSIESLSADGTHSTVVPDLDYPSGITFDGAGNLYYGNVTDSLACVDLFMRSPDGTVRSLGRVIDRSAGGVYIGGWGFDLAVSPNGDIYYNYPSVFDKFDPELKIRSGSIERLSPDGTRTTVVCGLDYPSGLAFDTAGNLYYGNVTDSLARVDLFMLSPDGTVTSLGQVIDRSAGAVYIGGWGFDVAIPEPGMVFLLGLGGLVVLTRKRRA